MPNVKLAGESVASANVSLAKVTLTVAVFNVASFSVPAIVATGVLPAPTGPTRELNVSVPVAVPDEATGTTLNRMYLFKSAGTSV